MTIDTSLISYQSVVRYQTLDGKEHATPDKARDHAESLAGEALDALLNEHAAFQAVLTAHERFTFACHLLKNSARLIELLKPLHSFEAEQAQDRLDGLSSDT